MDSRRALLRAEHAHDLAWGYCMSVPRTRVPSYVVSFFVPCPESRPRRRIVAAISLDTSMVLELMAPLASSYFLPIASVANVGQ